MDYLRDENRVHLVAYHLVWTPKRRKPVLTGDVATDCRALIEGKCDEMGWHILDLKINPDHVRLTVRVWPTNSAADVVKECKAVTSHELWRKYPDLKRLPSLWTRAYFAATVGDVSESIVERYIQAQKSV